MIDASTCGWCGVVISQNGRGRRREYCCDGHRVNAHRYRGSEEFLYRAYDAAGALLYVGRSKRLPERLASHNAAHPWWHSVRRIDVEPVAEGTGRATEDEAIRNERPAHNQIVGIRQPAH